jgi:hypothetical protein
MIVEMVCGDVPQVREHCRQQDRVIIYDPQYYQSDYPVFPRVKKQEDAIFLTANIPLIIIVKVVDIG